MIGEMQRLYFGIKKNKIGQEKYQLLNKNTIEEAREQSSFLLSIAGSNLKYTNVDIVFS